MKINPKLSAIENLQLQLTNPALVYPTRADQLGATAPANYNPSSLGTFLGAGRNLDGESSNTQVILYLRPTLEDVVQDGVNQVLIYERKRLSDAVDSVADVQVSAQMSEGEILQAIASALGVVGDAIGLGVSLDGLPESVQIDALQSLLYLPGAVTVGLKWT